jgi:hypothetical protein
MTKREKELLKRGQKNLRKKLIFEKRLAKQVRGFFARQNKQIKELYKGTGLIFDANATKDELESIMYRHYQKVASSFSPEILREVNRELRINGYNKIEDDNLEISLALLLFISQAITSSVAKITATTNKETAAALQKTGGNIDETMAILRPRGINRSHVIATTENQKAVEGAKATTAETVPRAAAGILIGAATATTAETVPRAAAGILIGAATITQKKTWITRADGKVRSWHNDAQFQSVPVNEPFFVMGEFLMHPGDDSLGATAANLANCRCNAIYEFSVL